MQQSKMRMIWRLMAGNRRTYAMSILAMVLGSCFLYLVPLVPQVVLDGVLTDHPEKASRLVRAIVAAAGGGEAIRGNLWVAGLLVLLLTAASGYLTYHRGRLAALASERIARDVRERLYDQLQHLPCAYHDKAETGDHVQRCTSDVETLRQFLRTQIVEIGRALIMMAVPIPLMLALDRRMTIVSVVTLPGIVLFSYLFFHRVRGTFKAVDEAEGKMTSTLQESLTGIRVVRAFARQAFEIEKFDERNATHRSLDFRLYRVLAWFWSISDLACMAQKTLVVGAGAYWLAQGTMQVGTFYFFLAAVNLFLWPMRMLGRILTELGKATVAIGRIGEILDHPREADPAPEHVAEAPAWRGAIVFDRVVFTHADGTRALDGVSFRVRPGSTLALLGPSGAGKSTIVQILLRFYDAQEGEVLMDGVPIRALPRKAVRGQIAVVMQEPFLYSKTIRENIRFGRRSATDEEIVEAAVTASIHASIEGFANGYDTIVGERGVTLSGGQRQRVALARALLHKPAVLVLDDALSAVDTDTEAMILEALHCRRGRQTTILIAHRLSTLMHADEILVLDEGRILQRGTHEALAREEGLYRRLWKIQAELEGSLKATMDEARTTLGSDDDDRARMAAV